jgi:hypothetical protein
MRVDTITKILAVPAFSLKGVVARSVGDESGI